MAAWLLLGVGAWEAGASAAAAPPVPAPAEGGQFSLTWSQERFSLTSQGARLGEILERLAQEAGFKLQAEASQIKETVNERFTDVGLHSGLDRILQGRSYLVLRDAQGRVTKLVVLGLASEEDRRADRGQAQERLRDQTPPDPPAATPPVQVPPGGPGGGEAGPQTHPGGGPENARPMAPPRGGGQDGGGGGRADSAEAPPRSADEAAPPHPPVPPPDAPPEGRPR